MTNLSAHEDFLTNWTSEMLLLCSASFGGSESP
jgi:hypothetical protein